MLFKTKKNRNVRNFICNEEFRPVAWRMLLDRHSISQETYKFFVLVEILNKQSQLSRHFYFQSKLRLFVVFFIFRKWKIEVGRKCLSRNENLENCEFFQGNMFSLDLNEEETSIYCFLFNKKLTWKKVCWHVHWCRIPRDGKREWRQAGVWRS